MKKTIIISLIIGFLISCGNDKTISEIEDYVRKTDNRSDLESIAMNYRNIYLDSTDFEIAEIYYLTDKNGDIPRMFVYVGTPNKILDEYTFYFKQDSLVFARVIQFDELGIDTIANSNYYYKGIELLKQIDNKPNLIDAETIRQVSEFYQVYAKEKNK